MSVSVRCNDVEPYHCEARLHQQPAATTTHWSSFYHTSSFNHYQHFQHSTPMPYFDHCNAVLPACSWRQLSTAPCSSIGSNVPWSGLNNSASCSTQRPDQGLCSYVQRLTNTAGSLYTNAHQLVATSDSRHLMFARTQPQIFHHDPRDTVDATAQRPSVDEFQTLSSTQCRSNETPDSPATQSNRRPRRTKEALVPLIIRSILSAAEVRLSLSGICRYIEQHSLDYASADDDTRWHNNVRHTLSHYEFFVKCGRVPTGRGNYWTIHPVCRASFAADDYRIKRARHAVQVYEKSVNVSRHQHAAAVYTDWLAVNCILWLLQCVL